MLHVRCVAPPKVPLEEELIRLPDKRCFGSGPEIDGHRGRGSVLLERVSGGLSPPGFPIQLFGARAGYRVCSVIAYGAPDGREHLTLVGHCTAAIVLPSYPLQRARTRASPCAPRCRRQPPTPLRPLQNRRLQNTDSQDAIWEGAKPNLMVYVCSLLYVRSKVEALLDKLQFADSQDAALGKRSVYQSSRLQNADCRLMPAAARSQRLSRREGR